MIDKFDIAIGIPSYNESTTIAYVVKQIDIGLSLHFPKLKCIIVNVDNDSPDNTREIFLSTKTKNSKRYIPTAKGVVGKGENLKNFFDFANTCGAMAAAIFDGDLESIKPEWINYMISAILHSGYDFIFPFYTRYRYDGAITSQFCYPLLAGVFGKEIRQPIGGDFGFSQKLIQSLASSPLPDEARTFGIDIFITTQALIKKVSICGVGLGRKIHRKRDRSTLGPMFNDVTHSLFNQIKKGYKYLENVSAIESTDILTATNYSNESCSGIPVDIHTLEQIFYSKFDNYLHVYEKILPQELVNQLYKMFQLRQPLFINSEMWCEIIHGLLIFYITSNTASDEIVESINPLFFARLISFIEMTKKYSDDEVESYVKKQAEIFFMNRNKFLELLPQD